jgi:hypothetical protein
VTALLGAILLAAAAGNARPLRQTAEQTCPVTARISNTKAVFIEGEPVALRLTFTNPGAASANLFANYPYFKFRKIYGVLITTGYPTVASRSGERTFAGIVMNDLDGSMSPVGGDGSIAAMNRKIPVIPIAPGTTWAVDIYLQQFLTPPAVGRHRVTYAIDARCDDQPNQPRGAVRQDGPDELDFTVVPGTPAELGDVIKTYGARLDALEMSSLHKGNGDWEDNAWVIREWDSNEWEARAVKSAITFIDDPQGCPALEQSEFAGRSAFGLPCAREVPS